MVEGGPVECGSNQRDDDEVVEVSGLQTRILTVVAERQELPRFGIEIGLVAQGTHD
ncbi:hypothetical protein LAUMK35_00997 [Mycobacterium pseudokansasii]|nr:hypothetical protein LAUMK35_00997 [Mycobacterium pseudokansasii]VAZ90432.1 hypothetical protein LAUMK21_00997 [Mycobacterium pseudokansasii]